MPLGSHHSIIWPAFRLRGVQTINAPIFIPAYKPFKGSLQPISCLQRTAIRSQLPFLRTMASMIPPNESIKSLDSHSNASLMTSPFPACHPKFNPVDIYRVHLANTLAAVTGVGAQIIYPALARTQTQDKGDLALAVPALRVKGEKPADLAVKWAKEVCLSE